jgi:hypothetical protein
MSYDVVFCTIYVEFPLRSYYMKSADPVWASADQIQLVSLGSDQSSRPLINQSLFMRLNNMY